MSTQPIVQSQPVGQQEQFDEFDYKPVPPLAPVTLVVGICSAAGLLGVFGLFIPLMGIVLGGVGLLQIRRAEGYLGGRMLVLTGLTLSVVFLVSGLSWHTYAYATEVPEGFQRVNFPREIAKPGFVIEDGIRELHPDVAALDGQRIFLKGYMYPTGQMDGLTSFILCKDNQQCCFGGNPELTDMILVKMQNGLTARFTPGLVSVAGVFRTNDPSEGGMLEPVYELDAEMFTFARTSF